MYNNWSVTLALVTYAKSLRNSCFVLSFWKIIVTYAKSLRNSSFVLSFWKIIYVGPRSTSQANSTITTCFFFFLIIFFLKIEVNLENFFPFNKVQFIKYIYNLNLIEIRSDNIGSTHKLTYGRKINSRPII